MKIRWLGFVLAAILATGCIGGGVSDSVLIDRVIEKLTLADLSDEFDEGILEHFTDPFVLGGVRYQTLDTIRTTVIDPLGYSEWSGDAIDVHHHELTGENHTCIHNVFAALVDRQHQEILSYMGFEEVDVTYRGTSKSVTGNTANVVVDYSVELLDGLSQSVVHNHVEEITLSYSYQLRKAGTWRVSELMVILDVVVREAFK